MFATVSEKGEGRVFDVVNFGGSAEVIKRVLWFLMIEWRRHDQYLETGLHAQDVLLGTPSVGWADVTCDVSASVMTA